MLGLPSLLNPKGMGMGDAKLIGVLGLFLGAAVAPAFFVAFLLGTRLGIAIIVRKGMSRAARRPSRSGRSSRSAGSSACSPATSWFSCT